MAKKKLQRKNKVRVYIVCDYPIVRYGLSKLIGTTSDLFVGGESDISIASRAVLLSKPDLVIVWIRGAGDIALVEDLKNQNPKAKILVFSNQSNFPASEPPAGADGYLMKQEEVDTLLPSMRRIHRGELVVSEKMASQSLPQKISHHRSLEARVKDLTDRELEVFRLIGREFKTSRIARELGLSVKTIQTYRERIKTKLGLKDAIELISNAVRWVQSQNQ